MDEDWAISQLQQFIDMTGPSSRPYEGGWYRTAAGRDDILAAVGVVRAILDAATPDWQQAHLTHVDQEFGQMRDAALEARERLTRAKEISAHLDPPAPALSSDSLHPWVWEPAKDLWADGHHWSALHKASVSVDQHIQKLVDRSNVTGVALANEVLSDKDPEPGKSRLRVPYQGNDDTTDSVQRGLRALGQACFWLTRNPSSHIDSDMSESEALEHLAMLSLFARTVATCKVVEAEQT